MATTTINSLGYQETTPRPYICEHSKNVFVIPYPCRPVAATCPKSWGSRLEATSLPPSILLFSFPLVDFAWVWAEPVHPLPNILMKFLKSNSLRKSTLMFNVLPGT